MQRPPRAESDSLVAAANLLLTLTNREQIFGHWTADGDASQKVLQARNPWLLRMAAWIALMLASVVAIPALRQIMGLACPDTAGMQAIALMAALSAAWLIALRSFYRRR
jgi:hypothetical protein